MWCNFITRHAGTNDINVMMCCYHWIQCWCAFVFSFTEKAKNKVKATHHSKLYNFLTFTTDTETHHTTHPENSRWPHDFHTPAFKHNNNRQQEKKHVLHTATKPHDPISWPQTHNHSSLKTPHVKHHETQRRHTNTWWWNNLTVLNVFHVEM